MGLLLSSLVLGAVNVTAPMRLETVRVSVDCTTPTGPVKAVNGVGQPPKTGLLGFGLFNHLTKAGIPYSRLHDVGGVQAQNMFVDIPNVFRDFEADETDPANYDFAFTDELMKALEKAKVEPIFRLGVTIENYPHIKRYRIFPPKDFAKWARVCEHVIRHYTEGWANGFRMKISYWEIWNEADFHPDQAKNMMWYAPFSEYCRLYGVAAKHLKEKFPHLKIGGYASCGFYVASEANPNEQQTHHLDCIREFLDYVRREKCPLDFFSFHSYAKVEDIIRQISYGKGLLREYGFGDVETWLNEWLPAPSHKKLGTAEQASEIAAMLVGMQNSELDAACIYDARCGTGMFSPLFNPLTYEPHKAYYAFTAFNELRKLGTAVKVVQDERAGLWSAAACRGDDAALLIVNASSVAIPLEVSVVGFRPLLCRLTDDERTDAPVEMPKALPPQAFCVITFKREGAALSALDFRIRDPFVVVDKENARYCVLSTCTTGAQIYASADLIRFQHPQRVLAIPSELDCREFWAPEMHRYNGRWYIFGTVNYNTPRGKSHRGTWTFVSDQIEGPFRPTGSNSVTPTDWDALDGTLWIEDGKPFMVFCHEWEQTGDGEMCAVALTDDLSAAVGEVRTLFRATDGVLEPEKDPERRFIDRVTDGPFLYRSRESGRLFMLWSNVLHDSGYANLICESESGKVAGPWTGHRVLYGHDGGHGMIFESFDGRPMLVLHQPNIAPDERLRVWSLADGGKGVESFSLGKEFGNDRR